MPTIQQDVADDFNTGDLELDDAASAFLANFADKADDDASKKKPSEKGETSEDDANSSKEQETDDTEETDDEQSDESPDSEDEGEGDEGDEQDEDEKSFADGDNFYVKVKVGDDEHEVPVKDLTRLYGQEASLTRKSQEVAAERTKAEQNTQRALSALDVMVKRAKEAADPYRQVNWAALMKDPNISADDVGALQATARAAFENEAFLTQQLDGFMAQVAEEAKVERANAARECIATLTKDDPANKLHIPGWNEKLYNELREFGIGVGLHKQMVDNLTDPAAFKLLHMAMQFQRGAKKVQTIKVNKAPKKIVKTSVSSGKSSAAPKTNADRNKAVSKLRQTGTLDDAADAFLASFAD